MTFAQVIAPLPVWAIAALALALVNLTAYTLFGIDKLRARRGLRRISESTLLFFALFGGYLGAKAGQRTFRHKTRKQPFARNLNTLGALQVVFILVIVLLARHAALIAAVERFTAR